MEGLTGQIASADVQAAHPLDLPALGCACAHPPQAKPFTLWRAVVDALAASMLVTCLLDFWRIGVGSSILTSGGNSSGEARASGLPWMS